MWLNIALGLDTQHSNATRHAPLPGLVITHSHPSTPSRHSSLRKISQWNSTETSWQFPQPMASSDMGLIPLSHSTNALPRRHYQGTRLHFWTRDTSMTTRAIQFCWLWQAHHETYDKSWNFKSSARSKVWCELIQSAPRGYRRCELLIREAMGSSTTTMP